MLVIFGYAMVELIRLEDINIRPIKGKKQLNQKISTKEKFLIVYKRIFLIEPLHLVWVVFAFINLFYFGFIKYLLVYHAIAYNGLWLMKVFYELFFGFKDNDLNKEWDKKILE